jgi:hypothetical protein
MKLQWIFMVLMLMFIATACTKDALNTKDESPELKKADLRFNTEVTLYLDNVPVLPIAGRLEGILPHLGKLQVGPDKDSYTQGSYWEGLPSQAQNKDGYICIPYENITARFVAANGDVLIAKVSGFVYPPRFGGGPGGLNWIGTVTYEKLGTGRFANATGGGTITGVYTSETTIQMKSEGTLSNVGQSKKNQE